MTKYVQRKFYYISLNLGPAAGPVQAITIALQLPIIETRVTILLGLARADVGGVELVIHQLCDPLTCLLVILRFVGSLP